MQASQDNGQSNIGNSNKCRILSTLQEGKTETAAWQNDIHEEQQQWWWQVHEEEMRYPVKESVHLV